MTEFRIELEDSLVQTFGREAIENRLQEFINKAVLKLSAQDILADLETIDLKNDKEWQTARNLAWEQEKHKYSVPK